MPSPDQSNYTSLTLYDKGAFEIIQQAIVDVQTKLPNFVARTGTVEMALLEAMALEVDELIFAANRLPDGVMEVLMATFGIVRQLGNPPSATATLTAVDTAGYQIPAGVELRLDDGSGNTIAFFTTEAGVISPGSSQTTVAIAATANTGDFNGTASGTDLTVASPIAVLESAELDDPVSGGEGPETDDQWRQRAVQVFRAMSTALVTPDQFTAKALAYPGVYRANTKDNWNVSASATGHVTVAVADSSGAALSGGVMTALAAELDLQAHAALVVHVTDPTFNEVKVTVVATALPDFSPSEVQAAVEAAINDYLSPTNWGWQGGVRLYEMVALVSNVEGVDFVDSLEMALEAGTLNDADVSLTGSFPLTQPGTIDVTVNAF